ncbi:MAG: hypothetical protein GY943_23310 [Chloroflexi bacterium]|nr:hypothetical protein [Chloroflexota bacterium]
MTGGRWWGETAVSTHQQRFILIIKVGVGRRGHQLGGTKRRFPASSHPFLTRHQLTRVASSNLDQR